MQDQGYLLVNIQLPDSASLQRTSEVITQLERLALGDDTGKYHGPKPKAGQKQYSGVPGVAHTSSVAGQSFLLGANGSNFGSCFIILEPFADRTSHEEYDEVIAGKIRALVGQEIDDAVISVFRAPPIQGLGNSGGFKFQVEQRGFVDFVELQRATDDIVAAANKNPSFAGVFSMYRALTPQFFLDIDRTKCESLKVDVSEVFNTLQVYMGGLYVNLFNKFGRTWQVNVMADDEFRTRARQSRAAQSAQQARTNGAAGYACRGRRSRRSGNGHAVQHVSVGIGESEPGRSGKLWASASHHCRFG